MSVCPFVCLYMCMCVYATGDLDYQTGGAAAVLLLLHGLGTHTSPIFILCVAVGRCLPMRFLDGHVCGVRFVYAWRTRVLLFRRLRLDQDAGTVRSRFFWRIMCTRLPLSVLRAPGHVVILEPQLDLARPSCR